MNTLRSHKAFSLIEILLVVVAISILAGIVIIAINPERQLASFRDAARQRELIVIQNALDQYHIDNPGTYPPGVDGTYRELCITAGQLDCLDIVDDLVPEYMPEIPQDPQAEGASGYFIALHPTQSNQVSLQAGLSEGESPVVTNPIQWNPEYVSTRLWLDAADEESLVLDGTAVTQWRDKSGNNFHANQTVAARKPQYTTSALNSNNVVTFVAANTQRMTVPSVGLVQDIAVVYRRSFNTQPVFEYNVNPYNRGLLGHAYITGFTTHNQYAFNGGALQAVAPTAGVNAPSLAYASFTRITGITNSINLGGGTPAYTHLDGFIAEMIILTDRLDEADRMSVEGYLAHKWGLTDNLPDTHPYKTEVPIVQPEI